MTSHKCLELIPNPTPPPLAQLHHTWAFVHVGEYVWVIYALVSSTIIAPFDETTGVFRLLHPLAKIDFLPFIDDFHPKIKGYFRSRGIYLYFGLFTTSLFQWPFGYGIWIFTKLLFPKWFCKWLWLLFWNTWAHCSRSSSTFRFTLVFFISNPNVGKIDWRHTFHCN